MSEHRRSLLSRVYATGIDMPPSPSISDESENDAISPQPHTPIENGNIMEELHAALGEELLNQLEMRGPDDKDEEKNATLHATPTENETSGENLSRHRRPQFLVAPSGVGSSIGTDRRIDDVNASQKQSRLLCTTSTSATVDSTTNSYSSLTRGTEPTPPQITTKTAHHKMSDSGLSNKDSTPPPPNTLSLTDSPTNHDLPQMPPNVAPFSADESRDSSPIHSATQGTPPNSAVSDAMNDSSNNDVPAQAGSSVDGNVEVNHGGDSCMSSSGGKHDTPEKVSLSQSLRDESSPEIPNEEKKSENHSNVPLPRKEYPHMQLEEDKKEDESAPLTPPRRLPIFESIAVEPTMPLGEPVAESSNASEGLFPPSDEISDSIGENTSDRNLKMFKNIAETDHDLTTEQLIPEAVKQPDLAIRLDTPEYETTVRDISFERTHPALSDDMNSPSSHKSNMAELRGEFVPDLEKRGNERPMGSPVIHSDPWNVPIGTPSQQRNIMPVSIQTTPPSSYMVVANAPQVQHFVPEIPKPVAYGGYTLQAFPKDVLQPASTGGRRKIRLRLEEDVPVTENRRSSWFSRKSLSSPRLGFSKRNLGTPALDTIDSMESHVNRGSITVSWYEGTTSAELQEHVRKSVLRKLGLRANTQLLGVRVIDESMDPPEEIVLCSYIPDGSEFLLKFATKEPEPAPPMTLPRNLLRHSRSTDPPVSPSAARSPYQSSADLQGLTAAELKVLEARLDVLPSAPFADDQQDGSAKQKQRSKKDIPSNAFPESVAVDSENIPNSPMNAKATREPRKDKNGDEMEEYSRASSYSNVEDYGKDPIESRLRMITDLLLLDREAAQRERSGRREEKRQVVFVLANYFVLFLSLIAISAEIQARAPSWMEYLENQMESVQKCATDRDSLFECVSNGDFSGLIASFVLWMTRSAATKRIFLFGFESPKRLWTVVYEALVTAFCWGTSYTFIRRGMNPDTRRNFLQKYWKDAVYGSLAGFNASFMKAVLKNLIPQEAFENALDDRELRLKIFSFLPSFN